MYVHILCGSFWLALEISIEAANALVLVFTKLVNSEKMIQH